MIRLRRYLIAKLLLKNVWPTSVAFPNVLDVLGILATKLHCASAYKFPHIENNAMLGVAKFMVDFLGMHWNTKKALYINFKTHASIFCKVMLSKIHGGRHVWCYVLITGVCVNENYYLPMEDRYSGLICQHSLGNILNLSQRFIKSLHQPKNPHGFFGQFPKRQKGNKEA